MRLEFTRHTEHPAGPVDRETFENRPALRRPAADQILSAHETLRPLLERYERTGATEQFAPGPLTNQVFGALCRLAVSPHGLLRDIRDRVRPVVAEDIRTAAQLAETEMERHFARRVLAWAESNQAALAEVREGARVRTTCRAGGLSENVRYRLELLRGLMTGGPDAFPYFTNYKQMMVQGEAPLVSFLLGPGRSAARVAFLGSGPLDLSADLLAILAGELPVQVLSVDRDPVAVELSRRLLAVKEELGIFAPGVKTVVEADAAHLTFKAGDSAGPQDLVFLASMLGDPVRKAVVKNCRTAGVGAMVTRDAAGLVGDILYSPVGHEDFERAGYPFTACTVPMHQVLNGTGRPPARTHWLVPREVLNCAWGGTLSPAAPDRPTDRMH